MRSGSVWKRKDSNTDFSNATTFHGPHQGRFAILHPDGVVRPARVSRLMDWVMSGQVWQGLRDDLLKDAHGDVQKSASAFEAEPAPSRQRFRNFG